MVLVFGLDSKDDESDAGGGAHTADMKFCGGAKNGCVIGADGCVTDAQHNVFCGNSISVHGRNTAAEESDYTPYRHSSSPKKSPGLLDGLLMDLKNLWNYRIGDDVV